MRIEENFILTTRGSPAPVTEHIQYEVGGWLEVPLIANPLQADKELMNCHHHERYTQNTDVT
jgi:hypothetical protein